MEVKKYKKLNNGSYSVIFDDNTVLELYEETILKFELLSKKELNISIEEMINENCKLNCYYTAIKYLEFKNRSTCEVKTKLKSNDFKEEDITYTIEKLATQGYLNDSTYARSFLNDKLMTTNHGPNKIRNDLSLKGITNEIIEDTLKNYDYETQYEKVFKLITKIIKSNTTKSNNYLKRKIYNSLCYQGFSKEIIDKVIEETSFNNDNNLKEKEEEKLRKKYSSKYEGALLEYKIKEQLIKKGFY